MTTDEGFVLDGLDLNNSTSGTWVVEQADLPPPKKRAEWVTGDSDGGVLVRDPLVENREITLRLQRRAPAVSMDVALADIGALVDKLEESERQQDGLPLVWTPAGSTKTVTFYVLSGEMPELPVTLESGWLEQAPSLTVALTCKPFGYGAWSPENFLDAFAVNALESYLFDAGSAAALNVTGGALVPVTAGVSVPVETYPPLALTPKDAEATVKFTTPATVGTPDFALAAKRLDASNALLARVSSTALTIAKKDAGVVSTLATAAYTLLASTTYWLRVRVEGNVVTADLLNANPQTTITTPVATVTHTLAGGDQTKYGPGVAGRYGLRLTSGLTTAWLFDDLRVEPNTYVTSGPLLTFELPGVSGDASAEGRLIVQERYGQDLDEVEWGLEQRFYTSQSSLVLGAAALSVSGFSGALTTRSGENVVRATLTPVLTAMVGMVAQAHVGTYRVKARIWATEPTVLLRFSWQLGTGPLRPNDWVAPVAAGAFSEADLGEISIKPAAAGAQSWAGQIEAYSPRTGDILDVNQLLLIPAGEGYGRAASPALPAPAPALAAFDTFDQPAGALAGLALGLGGSWSGAGDADDFSAAGNGVAVRQAVSDGAYLKQGRIEVAGTNTFTNCYCGVDIYGDGIATGRQGLIARYTDVNNFLVGFVLSTIFNSLPYSYLVVAKVVGGVETQIANSVPVPTSYPWWTYFLSIDRYGRYTFARHYLLAAGLYVTTTSGTDPVLATGGALQSGKIGIYDHNTTTTVGTPTFAAGRVFDNFQGGSWAKPPVVYAGRRLEIRYDDCLSESSGGGVYGRPPAYRGSRLLIPPAGAKGRSARIAVKARRDFSDETADTGVGGRVSAQLLFRPRYIVAPR